MQHILLLVLYYIPLGICTTHVAVFTNTFARFRLIRQTQLCYQVMCGMALNHCIAIFVSTLYFNHILFPDYDVLLCLRKVVISLYPLFGKYVFIINYRKGVNTIL